MNKGMIKIVSSSKKVKYGLEKSFYCTDNFEILLSEIEPNVPLDRHAHAFAQFGYCFEGEFQFITGNCEYDIKCDGYYILRGNIEHGAVSNKFFYALDFKYKDNNEFYHSNSSRYELKEGSIEVINLPKANIYRCMPVGNRFMVRLSNSDLTRYLVSKQSGTKFGGQNEIELKTMKIYSFNGYECLEIQDGEVFIIEIREE